MQLARYYALINRIKNFQKKAGEIISSIEINKRFNWKDDDDDEIRKSGRFI